MATNSTINAGLAFDAQDLYSHADQFLAPAKTALHNIATNAENGLYPDDEATTIDKLVEQTGNDWTNVAFGVAADPQMPAYKQALEQDIQQLAAYGGTTIDPHDPNNTNPLPPNDGNDPKSNTPGEDSVLNTLSGLSLLSKYYPNSTLLAGANALKGYMQQEVDAAHVIDDVAAAWTATKLGQDTRPYQNQTYTDAGKLFADALSAKTKIPLPEGTSTTIAEGIQAGIKQIFTQGMIKTTQWISQGVEAVYVDALQTQLDYTKMQLVLQYPNIVFPKDTLGGPPNTTGQSKVQIGGRLRSVGGTAPLTDQDAERMVFDPTTFANNLAPTTHLYADAANGGLDNASGWTGNVKADIPVVNDGIRTNPEIGQQVDAGSGGYVVTPAVLGYDVDNYIIGFIDGSKTGNETVKLFTDLFTYEGTQASNANIVTTASPSDPFKTGNIPLSPGGNTSGPPPAAPSTPQDIASFAATIPVVLVNNNDDGYLYKLINQELSLAKTGHDPIVDFISGLVTDPKEPVIAYLQELHAGIAPADAYKVVTGIPTNIPNIHPA